MTASSPWGCLESTVRPRRWAQGRPGSGPDTGASQSRERLPEPREKLLSAAGVPLWQGPHYWTAWRDTSPQVRPVTPLQTHSGQDAARTQDGASTTDHAGGHLTRAYLPSAQSGGPCGRDSISAWLKPHGGRNAALVRSHVHAVSKDLPSTHATAGPRWVPGAAPPRRRCRPTRGWDRAASRQHEGSWVRGAATRSTGLGGGHHTATVRPHGLLLRPLLCASVASAA